MKIVVKGIDHVAINVRDLEKSVDFYTRVIGLNITQREPSKPGKEYFLDAGSSLLGLIQSEDLTDCHFFKNDGLGANHFSIRIDARDFDGFIRHLEDFQVRIEYAKKREKSWSMYFYDIDGNKVEATAWPREDGLSEHVTSRKQYDPLTKSWNSY
jgi:catechol-2,3-dioxygenase